MNENKTIAIIGLGYVGLPLAIAFGKLREVIGYDKDSNRISQLIKGEDRTLETKKSELTKAKFLKFTDNENNLKIANIYVVTVPTPVNKNKKPNLSPLIKATNLVGKNLNKGDIVIFESTVYPGTTEEICVPILEKNSRLKFNTDFFCGYSPERINPGDKEHCLENVIKITSGSTNKISIEIDNLYKSIITAGTYMAPSIKTAEAAKIIENTQRDVNIALMNEISIIFHKMNIDTNEVLNAAETKWNFLKFRPGLVGGHCIGVDPYYLTYKANELGYKSEVILSGRRINDGMGKYVADKVLDLMKVRKLKILGSKSLILGYTFKENCPDIRNTKVIDIISRMKEFKVNIDVFDPWVNEEEIKNMKKFNFIQEIPANKIYSSIIIAVPHKQFKKLTIKYLRSLGKRNAVIYDVKGILKYLESDGRL